MQVPLKRHLDLFTKLDRRLSSVRWTLLLITTAMFFLSAASTGCPTGGYTLSVAPNLGPSVSNPPPPSSNLPPSPNDPPPTQPASQPPSQLPTSASAPAIAVVIPATPGGSAASDPPVAVLPPSVDPGSPAGGSAGAVGSPVAVPPPSGTTGSPPGGSAGLVAVPPPSGTTGSPPGGSAGPVAVPPPSGITGSPPGGGQVVMVKMVLDAKNPSGFGFSPATVTIKKGTKVTWVNVTAIPHTVTSDDSKFKSSDSASPVLQDQMYSFVFATAGTFKYHCAIHPPQVGTITVQ